MKILIKQTVLTLRLPVKIKDQQTTGFPFSGIPGSPPEAHAVSLTA